MTDPLAGHRHLRTDSPDFRAGMAYAAHILRHMVNLAHGGLGSIPPTVAMRPCCRQEVIAFACEAAEGMNDAAGVEAYPHTHPTAPAGGAQ